MAVTLRQVLVNALTYIGKVGTGQTAANEDLELALNIFRQIISQMNAKGIYAWYERTQTITLVTSSASYTIGPTAGGPTHILTDQDTRPAKIDRAKWILTDANPDVEMELIVINVQQFEGITIPALTTTLPSRLYYSPTWPNGTIQLWPIPTLLTNTLKLWWRNVIDIYTTSDYTVDLSLVFPDGWELALTLSVSELLCLPFQMPISQDLASRAQEARRVVIPNNEPPLLGTDSPDKGRPAGYSLSRFYSRGY